MNSFVEVSTLYELNKRTVEDLSLVYKDVAKLKIVVHNLVEKYISKDTIQNKSVLLKPNWVRQEIKESDYVCLRTNDNLLLCLLEELLSLSPSKILIADAPVQGCVWDKMITKDFLGSINALSKTYGIPVYVKDFRRTITDLQKNHVEQNLHPISDYVIFDLAEQSCLEPITTTSNRFRVTCYDPDKLAEVHHKGMHKYCVAKDVFDYDVIITIPKLKTHRMAGMTNALKLLVGINGDKDYLPHHRIGSIGDGGDNYQKTNLFRSISNHLTDIGNRHRGTYYSRLLEYASIIFWRISRPDKATIRNAGWYGNDTIWRTVMDLNRIALYGDKNGQIHDTQQRVLWSLMDGVIGGQGDGPLHPEPAPLGVIAFSNDPYLMDIVAGELYHINSNRVPLLRFAKKHIEPIDFKIFINSNEVELDDVKSYGIDIRMSPGWEDYNK